MPPWLDLNLIDTGHHLCTSNIYQIHQMIFLKVRHSNSLTRGVIVVAIIVVAAIVFFAVVVRGGGGGGAREGGRAETSIWHTHVFLAVHMVIRASLTPSAGERSASHTHVLRARTHRTREPPFVPILKISNIPRQVACRHAFHRPSRSGFWQSGSIVCLFRHAAPCTACKSCASS